MINLRNRREKIRWQRKLIQISISYENQLAKKIKPILGRQYMDAARLLEWGIENIECAVNEQYIREKKLFFNFSIKISGFFEQMMYNLLSEIYAQNVINFDKLNSKYKKETIQWFSIYSVFIAHKINRTTIKRIKYFIDREKDNGQSLRIIAKGLRRINKIKRAQAIARTIVHTVMNFSIQSAMNAADIDYIAEWISNNREQTKKRIFDHRKANGERVHKGNYFIRTGEELMFPGDPLGSIANIAFCRCILCYYVSKRGLLKHRRIGK